MRVAYLVLAHRQPNHLARLIGLLKEPGCAFFVHIDARQDEAVFRQALQASDAVVFVKKRIEVNWGGFTVVEATLSTLSEAFSFSPKFDRFCLLSGSDFPIKSNNRIFETFDSTTEFIRVDRKLNSRDGETHRHTTTFYWFMDSHDPALKRLSGKLPRRQYDLIDLYHGSNWWALTRDCLDYVLRFVASNSEYCSFFKHAFCSDEIFFHSIVKQSPYAPRIIHDFETVSDRVGYFKSNDHGCHYVDWNSPADGYPKVLDHLDFDKLLSSKSLFARKFEEPRSSALVTMLEGVIAVPRR